MAFAELHTTGGLKKIALRGTRVRSHLTAFHQVTTVEQTYVNGEDHAIEAVYTFPLPANAAVCGFEVIHDDGCIQGEIEASDDALRRYKDAMRQGDGAYLLEKHRPDVFSAWAGNLKPQQAVTIRLRYVAPLVIHEREIRVCFPTTIAPRYAANSGMDPIDAAIDADILNPPHVLHVPYGISLEVRIELDRALKEVASASHAIECEHQDRHVTVVRFARRSVDMDRDVVLQIKLDREMEPRASSSAGPDGESFVAVTFIPEFEPEGEQPPARESCFVLDCSGSMQGPSIDQARLALSHCLRALCKGDRFNICRFGSSFAWMSPEPLVFNTQTLADALRYVDQIQADLGGTELFQPLASLFKMPVCAGKVRDVILLTDGQVSNEPALIELARQHRTTHRLFTFGIGTAASHHLTQSLAHATGGEAEAVFPGERIEEKVMRTFSRMASPLVTDLSLAWGAGAAVEPATSVIRPVFDGDPVTILGRCPGTLPANVELSCTARDQVYHWRIAIPQPVASAEASPLPQLWANERLDELHLQMNGAQADSDRLHGRSVKGETVALSKRYGVLCDETTYVAVERRAVGEKAEGQAELRRVPLMLAAGWHGMQTERLSLVDTSFCVMELACDAAVPAPDSRANNIRYSRGPRQVSSPAKTGAPANDASQITQVLHEVNKGDKQAAERLLPLVYDELRKLARALMFKLPPGQTLQPTALVHEVFLRLVKTGDPGWDGRNHFFGAAARAMRNIIVDQARRKAAIIHGGKLHRRDVDEAMLAIEPPDDDVLAVHEALEELEKQDPRKGQIVNLRYFAGLTVEETAAVLNVSIGTIEREWRYIKAWLFARMSQPAAAPAAH